MTFFNKYKQEEIDQPKKMSIPPNETMKPNSKQPPPQQQPIHIENLEEKVFIYIEINLTKNA